MHGAEPRRINGILITTVAAAHSFDKPLVAVAGVQGLVEAVLAENVLGVLAAGEALVGDGPGSDFLAADCRAA